MKQNYKLLLSYDGSRYYGFERQKEQDLTIQGKLEAVLTAMPRNTREEVETFSAGRTDAGVHARGMCCNVFLDTNLTEVSLFFREGTGCGTDEESGGSFDRREGFQVFLR